MWQDAPEEDMDKDAPTSKTLCASYCLHYFTLYCFCSCVGDSHSQCRQQQKGYGSFTQKAGYIILGCLFFILLLLFYLYTKVQFCLKVIITRVYFLDVYFKIPTFCFVCSRCHTGTVLKWKHSRSFFDRLKMLNKNFILTFSRKGKIMADIVQYKIVWSSVFLGL